MSAQECCDITLRIFSSIQELRNQRIIQNAKSEILSLLSKFTPLEVLDAILPPLRHILCHKSNNRYLQAYFELVISLIIEFSHLSYSVTELCLKDSILEEILKLSDVKNKVVRTRTCQLLCHIVARDGATQIKLGVWEDRIYDCLLSHTRDKISSVRIEAIKGLANFMKPSDHLCPCVLRIMWHIKHDASSDVRKKCLQLLPLTNETLDIIVSQVADNSVEVKVTTLKILTENIHLKFLRMSEVMQILKIATFEQNKGVIIGFQNLFKKWLSLECDIIFILQRFDLIGEPQICSQTLQNFLKISPLGALSKLWQNLTGIETADLPPDGLLCGDIFEPSAISVEFSFLWLNLANFVHNNKEGSPVCEECVIPDPVQFSEYLIKFQEFFVTQNGAYSEQLRFIFENILQLLEFIDYSNESGRDRIIVSLRSLVTNNEFHLSLIEPSLRHFILICPDVDKRIMNLSTAIIAMNVSSQPPDIQDPYTQLSTPLTQTDTSLPLDTHTDTIMPPNTQESDTLDKSLRSLQITILLMQQVKVQQPDSQLLSLVNSVLLPNLLQEDFAVRELALKGLAVTSMTSFEMAHNVVPSFIMVATEALFLDHLSVQITALSSILDLFLLYGDPVFKLMKMLIHNSEPEESNPEPEQELGQEQTDHEAHIPAVKQHIISILLRVIQSDSPELQEIALIGLCKLFLANRIRSCNLLGQLLIRSFHPVTNTSPSLTEAIFAFFYSFTLRCQENCVLLADSLIPTLWTVFEAPEDTFLSLVSLDAVSDKVLFFLTHKNSHDLLVEQLLILCLNNLENEVICRSAVRCLSQSDLSHFGHQIQVVKHWGNLTNEIAKNSTNNIFIGKFQAKLKVLNPDYDIVSPCHFMTPKSATKSSVKKGYGRSIKKKAESIRESLTPRVKSSRHKTPINYTIEFSSGEES
ncbi:Condensin complex subunit 3 [Oopsacas minuta]|uniref:Condensin complex subunit 3 n=1 Tax=Oopsacas minuta TaxID=111878 RepID=A0AAV7KER9_9METZ|nr:Condensin complex subunit 3 [Oopsacas minuta]